MKIADFEEVNFETTHTPQGDGNLKLSREVALEYIETTHTPQGDGNLL